MDMERVRRFGRWITPTKWERPTHEQLANMEAQLNALQAVIKGTIRQLLQKATTRIHENPDTLLFDQKTGYLVMAWLQSFADAETNHTTEPVSAVADNVASVVRRH
jgi:hypothetical protein